MTEVDKKRLADLKNEQMLLKKVELLQREIITMDMKCNEKKKKLKAIGEELRRIRNGQ